MKTVKMMIAVLFFISSIPLSAAEIDQLTGRAEYQETIRDFTAPLNKYTNALLEEAVRTFNNEYQRAGLTEEEIHKLIAFEIYKLTAGNSLDLSPPDVPSKLDLLYVVKKIEKGLLQQWLESEENNDYYVLIEDNIYRNIYPELLDFNKSYIIKVGGELIGPDKIDHFFDQGYSYWLISDYGIDDQKAKEFGVESEYGWYGLKAGGAFSFADLKANWSGYHFYKNLFGGGNPFLAVSDGGIVTLKRYFDWSDYIDPHFDELKNPCFYTREIMALIQRHIQKSYKYYKDSYDYLVKKEDFKQIDPEGSDYLTENIEYEEYCLFDVGKIFSDGPVAGVFSGGGVHGVYQTGVWKALSDMGVDIGSVSGISLGAVAASAAAMGDFGRAKKFWLENGPTDSTPMAKKLESFVDEDKIRNSGMDFGMVRYSLTHSSEEYIDLSDVPAGELSDYILSNSNSPLFVDWSSREQLAIDMINRNKYYKAVLVSFDHSVEDLYLISIMPRFSVGPEHDFSRENLVRLLKMGYLDGLRAYGMVTGEQYYIYGGNIVKNMFCSLGTEDRLQAAELLEIDDLPEKSSEDSASFYERVIRPELEKAEVTENRLIEDFADVSGVAKLELYSQQELIGEAVGQYIKRPGAGVFYNRYHDFLSFLYLKTPGLVDSGDSLDYKYIKEYKNIK